MKHIVFLGDGMGDEPQDALGGRTAIEAADTPHMDRIAREGVCGLLSTVPEGLPPDSTVANLSVMGYDPRECLEGRGVLEAAAMGVDIGPDQHAGRLNLIAVRDERIVAHSGGNVSTPEAAELIAALREALVYDGVEFHSGVSYRHVLKLARPASKEVECAPPHDHLDERWEDLLPRAASEAGRETAELLADIARRSRGVLEDHPVNLRRAERGELKANCAWAWSLGRRPAMETFEARFGATGAVVAAVDLIRGIGVYAGMEAPRVPGATGLWDTNYEGKADAALALLAERDLVYIHVEAPDEAGHEGNLELKVRAIEDLDRRLIARVMAGAPEGTRFSILPDHYTPVRVRTHVSEPVPFAMMGPGFTPDDARSYGEAACARGRWTDFKGDDFMRRFLSADPEAQGAGKPTRSRSARSD